MEEKVSFFVFLKHSKLNSKQIDCSESHRDVHMYHNTVTPANLVERHCQAVLLLYLAGGE